MSVKGTIYAPSAAIDIDDTDVNYPIASRGLIARHLRIRGFQYHSGYNEPAFSNWIDTTAAARQVVFYVCGKSSGVCTQADPTRKGRAAVSSRPSRTRRPSRTGPSAPTSDVPVAPWPSVVRRRPAA